MSIQISTKKIKARKDHVCYWCNCKIEKGTIYRKSFNKLDDVFDWKNHIHCEEIAEHLKMFDDQDYGVTEDYFQECIREEYITIMSHHHSEIFEYEYFQYPNFEDQLKFVCNHHQIKLTKKDYEN